MPHANNHAISVAPLHTQDLLCVSDLSAAEISALFATAAAVKADPAAFSSALRGRSVAMLFEKPSLRTRVSFEVGVAKLGGHAVYLEHAQYRIGERESTRDYALNLERWTDAIVARVFAHGTLTELAASARIPVVNALSDLVHPCQALADLFTIRERFGDPAGLRLAYVGDGNNVCHALLLICAALGVHMTVVCPKGYEPSQAILAKAGALARATRAHLAITDDLAGVDGADALYTDTWISMGQEHESHRRMTAFADYQVDEELFARLGPRGVFMHCLPAKRGVEVTDAVVDSPNSIVMDQAENRLHVQNALLLHLLVPGFSAHISPTPPRVVTRSPSAPAATGL
ncbi:MAG: ornithine carbamoyltransferase [Phycisphaerales bacterium]|nr:ornithine carbamoyltransferase [Phycisphaerales bacterium]